MSLFWGSIPCFALRGIGGLVKLTAEYLQRAKEAEVRATELKDDALKRQWREIANGYRNLAQARLTSTSAETAAQQPLPRR
jgi:hypothetical protein